MYRYLIVYREYAGPHGVALDTYDEVIERDSPIISSKDIQEVKKTVRDNKNRVVILNIVLLLNSTGV